MSKNSREFCRVVGNKVPPTFDAAECCETCKHCHAHYGYDDPVSYYCNIDDQMPEEPELGSVSLEEMKTKKFRQKSDAYFNWRNTHEVFAGGHCEKCEPRKVKLKSWLLHLEEMSGTVIVAQKELKTKKRKGD